MIYAAVRLILVLLCDSKSEFLIFLPRIHSSVPGTEQYSKYSGYAESYIWKESHKDETPRSFFNVTFSLLLLLKNTYTLDGSNDLYLLPLLLLGTSGRGGVQKSWLLTPLNYGTSWSSSSPRRSWESSTRWEANLDIFGKRLCWTITTSEFPKGLL